MKATLRQTAGAVLALGLLATVLTGCTQAVALQPAADAINPKCASVVTHFPETVAGLPSRETNAQATGAWGSPATVLLHCGVAVPDPTSTLVCVTVDGIDWLRDPAKDPVFAFITYGRDPAVEVVIDSSKGLSGNTVLTDLSLAVSAIPAERQCVTPDESIEGGLPVDTPTSSATPVPTATPLPTATPAPSVIPVPTTTPERAVPPTQFATDAPSN
ncbi:DUF3515 family protein [Glaciihabitans sp. dw_435]|uniref:DUF3515 family protein n=1 Tax=Glaciihabitans sp. dw_435 TaxID=2720081 RepID=UPI001BD3BC26|nr:DUF3515 family protein [Glaciihabitans sp. dw_435]